MTKPKSAHTTGRENILRWDVVRAAQGGRQISEIIGSPNPCVIRVNLWLTPVVWQNRIWSRKNREIGAKQVRVMDYAAAERNGRFLGGLFMSGFAL
jgi:hypothetical protein